MCLWSRSHLRALLLYFSTAHWWWTLIILHNKYFPCWNPWIIKPGSSEEKQIPFKKLSLIYAAASIECWPTEQTTHKFNFPSFRMTDMKCKYSGSSFPSTLFSILSYLLIEDLTHQWQSINMIVSCEFVCLFFAKFLRFRSPIPIVFSMFGIRVYAQCPTNCHNRPPGDKYTWAL